MGFFARLIEFKKPDEALHNYAKRLGISYTSLRLYKSGGAPTAVTVLKLATKLGISPGWLVFGDEDKKPASPEKTQT